MELDLWNCFGRVKLVLYQNLVRLVSLFVVIQERGNPILYANNYDTKDGMANNVRDTD